MNRALLNQKIGVAPIKGILDPKMDTNLRSLYEQSSAALSSMRMQSQTRNTSLHKGGGGEATSSGASDSFFTAHVESNGKLTYAGASAVKSDKNRSMLQ